MSTTRLVVIGTSGGGLEALRLLVDALPADFPAALAIVMHTSPQSPGVLHEILHRAGPLTAVEAADGARIEPGHIYVAPPDHHLLVEPGRLRLTRGPKENRFRPAIDPLFRSAAQVLGPAAIGVILTGSLDDGTAGLWTIKQLGGTAIVQDPADALFPSMPRSAVQHVNVDHVLPLQGIAPLLARLAAAEVGEMVPGETPDAVAIEVRIAGEEDPLAAGIGRIGTPSPIACPECHGVLLRLKEGGRIRFRCHTGHAYSPDSLLSEVAASIETALWTAMRSMHEGALLMRHVAEHHGAAPEGSVGAALVTRAQELERQADHLREMATAAGSQAPRN